MPEHCACGRPLHYTDPENYRRVQALVEQLGARQPVTNMESGRTWLIPRHFIALHGIRGWELPALAARYGFEEVVR